MNERHSDMIIMLANGISQRRMYFDDHPKVLNTARKAAASLNMLGGENGDFSLGVYNNKFVLDGSYLVGPSIAGRSLIDFAERLGCGGMVFHPPLSQQHLIHFFRLGSARFDDPANLDEAQALFQSQGLENIQLLPAMSEGDHQPGDGDGVGTPNRGRQGNKQGGLDLENSVALEFAPLLRVYQSMYDAVSGNNHSSVAESGVDLDNAREIGDHFVEISGKTTIDVMQFLRYPDYDSYTVGHSVRVAALSVILGRHLGWSESMLKRLATAGLLHDLGKGLVPEEILFKQGRLTREERLIMERHPVSGVQILLEQGERDPVIISATWGHHIWHDGRGYPHMEVAGLEVAGLGNTGLGHAGYRPGAVAELVHVCDVFEALTAHRPYKEPMPTRRAYEIMLEDRGQFHPTMLAEFIKVMGLYPTGTEVNLTDGSSGVVVGAGRGLDRPRVRIIVGRDGGAIPADEQPTLALDDVRELKVASMTSVGFGNREAMEV